MRSLVAHFFGTRPVLRLIVFISLAAQFPVWAHGDLHKQIARCTQKIQHEPARAELHLRRAELHRLHGEWDLALTDCASAEKLDPKTAAANLIRGKTFFNAGKFQQAKIALDVFLAAEPKHAEALLTRGRLLVKMNSPSAAERDFTAAINASASPQPDHFLERAQAMLAAQKIEAALAGLDEGIRKLGPLISLESLAVELELRQNHFDAALARVEKISAQSARKEAWLVLRGEIFERAGRRSEALAAFRQALAAMESLPPRRRETKTCRELQSKIELALARLQEPPARP